MTVAASPVSKQTRAELLGTVTDGVLRHEVFTAPGAVTSRVLTDPGNVAPWHSHLDHDTVVYVVKGDFNVETVEGTVAGTAGDCLLVPRHTFHREINPGTTVSEVVVVRTGSGPDYQLS